VLLREFYESNPIIDHAEAAARAHCAAAGDLRSVVAALDRWEHGHELTDRERLGVIGRLCALEVPFESGPAVDRATAAAQRNRARLGDLRSVVAALERWEPGGELTDRQRLAVIARFCPAAAALNGAFALGPAAASWSASTGVPAGQRPQAPQRSGGGPMSRGQ
jgi:hypothetical protein